MGKLSFTLQEAADYLGKSKQYVSNKVHALRHQGLLISPLKGFYVIVPLAHRTVGPLPAADVVVITMQQLGVPYYAGLLTAAMRTIAPLI